MRIMKFIQQKIAKEKGTFWFSFFCALLMAVTFCLAGVFAFCMIKMSKEQNILYGLPVMLYFVFILWILLTGKMN